MGQYYKAAVRQDGKFYAFNLSGWKLMESSWLGNEDVAAVMAMLLKPNAHTHVWWVGDYTESMLEAAEEQEKGEQISFPIPAYAHDKTEAAYARKLADELWGDNYKNLPLASEAWWAWLCDPSKDYILVNDTKREFIRWSTYKTAAGANRFGWHIHPLPLLCATSNGLGGGDYRGVNEELCGAWVGDLLSACEETESELARLLENGYTESKIHFCEE